MLKGMNGNTSYMQIAYGYYTFVGSDSFDWISCYEAQG